MSRIAAGFAAAMLFAAVPASAQLFASKRADLARPVVLAPGQAAIVIGFRRPDTASAGKSGIVVFGRYDLDRRDLIGRPDGAKKAGDTTTYAISVRSGDRKLALDHAVMLVSPGDYVLLGAAPGPVAGVTNSFCFGAPTFRVNAGETVYFGDITPYLMVRLAEGNNANAMAWSSHPDDARAALKDQPALAAGFKAAELRNGATYGCFSTDMTAYFVPGAPSLPELTEADRVRIAALGPPTRPPAGIAPAASAPVLVPVR